MQVSLLLFFVFSFLSGIHIYWVLGGTWGLDRVVPTQAGQGKEGSLFQPPPWATIGVALGLAAMGLLALAAGNWWVWPFSERLLQWGIAIVGGIFLLRAVGDFRYVGFFKKIKETPFAIADTRLYSPLCLALSLGMAYLFFQL